MNRKNTTYIGLGMLHSFRHPLEVLDFIPYGLGGIVFFIFLLIKDSISFREEKHGTQMSNSPLHLKTVSFIENRSVHCIIRLLHMFNMVLHTCYTVS